MKQLCSRSQIHYYTCAELRSYLQRQANRTLLTCLRTDALASTRVSNHAGVSGVRSTNRTSGRQANVKTILACVVVSCLLDRATNAGSSHGWRTTGQSEAHAASGSLPPHCQRLPISATLLKMAGGYDMSLHPYRQDHRI